MDTDATQSRRGDYLIIDRINSSESHYSEDLDHKDIISNILDEQDPSSIRRSSSFSDIAEDEGEDAIFGDCESQQMQGDKYEIPVQSQIEDDCEGDDDFKSLFNPSVDEENESWYNLSLNVKESVIKKDSTAPQNLPPVVGMQF